MNNPFSNPAFSMAALTAAINILPNRYGRLEELNLMPPKAHQASAPSKITTKSVSVLPTSTAATAPMLVRA